MKTQQFPRTKHAADIKRNPEPVRTMERVIRFEVRASFNISLAIDDETEMSREEILNALAENAADLLKIAPADCFDSIEVEGIGPL